MITINLTSTTAMQLLTSDASLSDVILNNSHYFVSILIPSHSSNLYPISPGGTLWLGEHMTGEIFGIINGKVKKLEANPIIEVRLMTLDEYQQEIVKE